MVAPVKDVYKISCGRKKKKILKEAEKKKEKKQKFLSVQFDFVFFLYFQLSPKTKLLKNKFIVLLLYLLKCKIHCIVFLVLSFVVCNQIDDAKNI